MLEYKVQINCFFPFNIVVIQRRLTRRRASVNFYVRLQQHNFTIINIITSV